MGNGENGFFTILSAEDDEDYFHLLNIILSKELKVNKVEHVVDGEELVSYLQKRSQHSGVNDPAWPSLILLDLNMPRKNGIEALKEIRANQSIPPIPIIALTVSSDLRDIETCYNYGVNAFITKPTDLNELIETLRAVIRYWKTLHTMLPAGR